MALHAKWWKKAMENVIVSAERYSSVDSLPCNTQGGL